MKKLFIIAAAAIAMTACTSEEDVFVKGSAQKEIGFGAVNYSLSRSTPNDGVVFNTGNLMYVSANYKGTATGAAYAPYFTGKTFKYKGDTVTAEDDSNNEVNYWANWNTDWAPIYYPMEGTMQFMAYSAEKTPASIDWGATSDYDKQLTNSCEVTWTNLDGYDDVMYSNIITATCSKDTKVKSFEFRHALAWIFYNVQSTVDGAVKVYDIQLHEAALNGTAKFNFAAPSVTWVTTAATTGSTVSVKNGTLNSTTVASGKGQAVTTTSTAWGNGLLVPTQTEKSFTMYYTITNDGTESAMMQYTYEPKTTPSATTWTVGNKYIYNINIGLNEIKVNGSVIKFGDGVTTPVSI